MDYLRSGRPIVAWLLTAMSMVLACAAMPTTAGAQLSSANGLTYECQAAPPHPATPPPLPEVVAAQAQAQPAAQPLCTDGKVPQPVSSTPRSVIKEASELKVLPQIASTATSEQQSLGALDADPLNSSGCPYYESAGAYYCHVIEYEKPTSPGVGLWGQQSQQAPLVDPASVGAHSISQMWAINRTTGSDVEFGWTVDPGLFPNEDPDYPHLFVFWFDGGYAGEYDPPYDAGDPEASLWIPYSGATEAPGEPVTYADTFHEYGVTKDANGNWWFYHNNNWLGYFPAHDWTHAPFTSYTYGETGGEVADNTSQICSQMGNGETGSSGTAAMWREAWKETEGVGSSYLVGHYNDEEGAPTYTYGNTDSEIGQFRYGGDGFKPCATNVPPLFVYGPRMPREEPRDGTLITAISGGWTNETSYTYQWNRCLSGCTAIPGATSPSYRPVLEDVGHRLTVTQTAHNAYGESSATSEESEKVLPYPPRVAAQTVENITRTSASVAAQVDPEGAVTKYRFEYGLEKEKYEHVTAEASAGSENKWGNVYAAVTGLLSCHTYHFRVVAWNEGGRTYEPDQEFETECRPPQAATKEAKEVKRTSTALEGEVYPNGIPTNYWFEYGKKGSFESKTAITEAGNNYEWHAEHATVSSLEPCHEYQFRVVAENEDSHNGPLKGAVYGETKYFETKCKPLIQSVKTSELKPTSVVLNAEVNPQEAETTYHFEYDTREYKEGEAAHGASVPVQPASIGSGAAFVKV